MTPACLGSRVHDTRVQQEEHVWAGYRVPDRSRIARKSTILYIQHRHLREARMHLNHTRKPRGEAQIPHFLDFRGKERALRFRHFLDFRAKWPSERHLDARVVQRRFPGRRLPDHGQARTTPSANCLSARTRLYAARSGPGAGQKCQDFTLNYCQKVKKVDGIGPRKTVPGRVVAGCGRRRKRQILLDVAGKRRKRAESDDSCRFHGDSRRRKRGSDTRFTVGHFAEER